MRRQEALPPSVESCHCFVCQMWAVDSVMFPSFQKTLFALIYRLCLYLCLQVFIDEEDYEFGTRRPKSPYSPLAIQLLGKGRHDPRCLPLFSHESVSSLCSLLPFSVIYLGNLFFLVEAFDSLFQSHWHRRSRYKNTKSPS